jgi:hypothetical protein
LSGDPEHHLYQRLGRRLGRIWKRRFAELLADTVEVVRFARIGEEAEMADLHEAGGQHVQQESADELLSIEVHLLLEVVVAAVAITEGDTAIVEGQDAMVGDGDAVGVAAEVVEYLSRAGKGALGIDDSRLFSEGVQKVGEPLRGLQGSGGAGELERVLPIPVVQEVQVPGTERLCEGMGAEEKGLPGRMPEAVVP